MSFITWMESFFETDTSCHGIDFNPATGLPMSADSGIDVGGSAYGTDIHEQSFFEHGHTSYHEGCFSSTINNDWHSGGTSWES